MYGLAVVWKSLAPFKSEAFRCKTVHQSQQKHGRKSVTGEQASSGTCANLADILGGTAEAL